MVCQRAQHNAEACRPADYCIIFSHFVPLQSMIPTAIEAQAAGAHDNCQIIGYLNARQRRELAIQVAYCSFKRSLT